MTDKPLRTFLDVSIGHVSRATALWLEENGSACGIYVGDTGFMIWAKSDFPGHPDLQKVLERARALGADYLMLDADAPQVDDLPAHDW